MSEPIDLSSYPDVTEGELCEEISVTNEYKDDSKVLVAGRFLRRLLFTIRRLRAEIGEPPAGSHPDEAKPRAATWHAERANWAAEVDRLRAALSERDAENERLRAIVNQLPKTADGVPVMPGTSLYCPMGHYAGHAYFHAIQCYARGCDGKEYGSYLLYSNHEAAAAARKAGEGAGR